MEIRTQIQRLHRVKTGLFLLMVAGDRFESDPGADVQDEIDKLSLDDRAALDEAARGLIRIWDGLNMEVAP